MVTDSGSLERVVDEAVDKLLQTFREEAVSALRLKALQDENAQLREQLRETERVDDEEMDQLWALVVQQKQGSSETAEVVRTRALPGPCAPATLRAGLATELATLRAELGAQRECLARTAEAVEALRESVRTGPAPSTEALTAQVAAMLAPALARLVEEAAARHARPAPEAPARSSVSKATVVVPAPSLAHTVPADSGSACAPTRIVENVVDSTAVDAAPCSNKSKRQEEAPASTTSGGKRARAAKEARPSAQASVSDLASASARQSVRSSVSPESSSQRTRSRGSLPSAVLRRASAKYIVPTYGKYWRQSVAPYTMSSAKPARNPRPYTARAAKSPGAASPARAAPAKAPLRRTVEPAPPVEPIFKVHVPATFAVAALPGDGVTVPGSLGAIQVRADGSRSPRRD